MKRKKLISKIFLNYKVTSVIVILFVLIMAILGRNQISAYENSVLSIYADQQDAYVQLVLDQINVVENRSDEEIITRILSSLDTSNRKYWTLSKDQALLFVKDITETNRYKGFTASTFFASDSASEFLQKLAVNQVNHEIIDMDKEKYVASGVIFEYNGSQYKICLLTNETVILDNNVFLSSKIGLYIYIIAMLCILLLIAMILSGLLDTRNKRIDGLVKKTEELNRIVESLEEKIKAYDYYHTRFHVFHEKLLEVFVKKLAQRDTYPVTFLQIRFKQPEQRLNFLERGKLLLDEKVVRFSREENVLVLIFVQYPQEDALKAVEKLQTEGVIIEKAASREDEMQSLLEVYHKFREETSDCQD